MRKLVCLILLAFALLAGCETVPDSLDSVSPEKSDVASSEDFNSSQASQIEESAIQENEYSEELSFDGSFESSESSGAAESEDNASEPVSEAVSELILESKEILDEASDMSITENTSSENVSSEAVKPDASTEPEIDFSEFE